jgi:hypothetical protein
MCGSAYTKNICTHHDHIEPLVVKFARFPSELGAHSVHVLHVSFIEEIYHTLADVYTNKAVTEWSQLLRDKTLTQQKVHLVKPKFDLDASMSAPVPQAYSMTVVVFSSKVQSLRNALATLGER